MVLGGCRLFNDSSLAIDPYLSKCIRERCSEIQPELKSAKQIEEICGLRPQRSPVRVEPELINTSYGKIKVIQKIYFINFFLFPRLIPMNDSFPILR